jgi:co-chaperonin GroES (HSP10)
MKAIGKYIIINPIKETETKTKGGLLLSESQREDIRYRKADVIVTGTDVAALKEGDKIYYDKAAGFSIEIKKDKYKVIKEHDVVVVL